MRRTAVPRLGRSLRGQGESSAPGPGGRARRGRRPAPLPIALAVALAVLVLAPAAGAQPYLPPRGKIYHGVSDSGELRHFRQFQRQTNRHPAVMNTFHTWGTSLRYALNRWHDGRARPMLSISTAKSYNGREVMTPRAIARGQGDDYLLKLNQAIGSRRLTMYIRPFGEMNAHWNPYCAYNANGSFRGAAHSTKWFRQAWRRLVIVIRGGDRRKRINARLRHHHMPPMESHRGVRVPRHLYHTRTAFLWVPQSEPAPAVRGNGTGHYWPGSSYVDWVGTDFFSKFPNWRGLNAFYRTWRGKPFVIGEWSVWGSDNAAFVHDLFHWTFARKRVRMLAYYNGFGNNNAVRIGNYPHARRKLRHILGTSNFQAYAPEWKPGVRN